MSDWGDNPCHAPLLLAWTMFKFVTLPKTDIEVCRQFVMTGFEPRGGLIVKYGMLPSNANTRAEPS